MITEHLFIMKIQLMNIMEMKPLYEEVVNTGEWGLHKSVKRLPTHLSYKILPMAF